MCFPPGRTTQEKVMKTMTKKLATIAAAIAFACLLSSNASATTLTINDQGVVGTLDGEIQGTNPSNELLVAEHILDMGVNSSEVQSPPPTVFCQDGNGDPVNCIYKTGSYDASGDLSIAGTGTGTLIPTTYDYILAKYDGPNAGYVLYYLPDYDGGSYLIPSTSNDIWVNGQNEGYTLSGWTAFNSTDCGSGCTPSVPDGGSTVTLLGSALVAFSMAARKFRKG